MLVRAASQKKKKPRMGQSQDVYTAHGPAGGKASLQSLPHSFREAKTAAASANASAKALPPRASAVFF